MNELKQVGEILQPTYEMGLVALSYCISVLGAFVALTAAQRIRSGREINWLNLLAAGTALGGIGVWSMHFTGMLALNLGMASGYAGLETVVSLIAAVAATCIALAYVAHNPADTPACSAPAHCSGSAWLSCTIWACSACASPATSSGRGA